MSRRAARNRVVFIDRICVDKNNIKLCHRLNMDNPETHISASHVLFLRILRTSVWVVTCGSFRMQCRVYLALQRTLTVRGSGNKKCVSYVKTFAVFKIYSADSLFASRCLNSFLSR